MVLWGTGESSSAGGTSAAAPNQRGTGGSGCRAIFSALRPGTAPRISPPLDPHSESDTLWEMPLPKDPEIQIAIEERMRQRRREASNSAEVEVALGAGSRRVLDFAKGIVTRIRGDENDLGTWEPYAAGAVFGGAATGIGYLAAGAPGALIGGGLALAGALRLGYLAAPEYAVRLIVQSAVAKPDTIELPEPHARRTLLDMIAIMGGEFLMGSRDVDLTARSYEKPQHLVRIRPFLLARTVVTRGQWKSFMPPCAEWRLENDDELPANYVNWHSARSFCNALSLREGLKPCYQHESGGVYRLDPDASGYRLPTEAEWEHACRAGTRGSYGFDGDEAALGTHGWYFRNSGEKELDITTRWDAGKAIGEWRVRPHPVGRKAANLFGLYDMHGNVWEWCEDVWRDNYHDAPVTGEAQLDGAQQYRVVRGGSFGEPAGFARSAYRTRRSATLSADAVGFRPARSGS